MRTRKRTSLGGKLGTVLTLSLIGLAEGRLTRAAQGESPPQETSLQPSLKAAEAEIHELHSALVEMNAEIARSRQEALGLRKQIQETREQLESIKQELGRWHDQASAFASAAPSRSPGAAPRTPEGAVDERLAKVEEEQQLLSAKVDDQYQTKVASASKHRVRLSGMALLNVFGTRGSVDNQDLPTLARPRNALDSNGNFGATVRQSLLGLEIFGPELAGAKSSGDLQFDFFGGFPNTLDGVSTGLARLRTARFRLDWPHTSLVAGQDAPFFSPLSPTSLASFGLPALAYSGNLWTWTPQIRVEDILRFTRDSSLIVQAGVLDPLTGELPYSQFYRTPQAGERNRHPAYAMRVGWTYGGWAAPLTFGAGGYYARQNWGFGRTVDSWAGTADWSVPLGGRFSLTGEFYRGRALGGLGGSLGRSVVFSGPLGDPNSSVLGLDSVGGWAQLKFRPTEKLEFNGTAGGDSTLASDLRRFAQPQSYIDPSVARNRSTSINAIYHVRSNLLFSAEYRHLRTDEIYAARYTADHINLGVGVLF